MKYFITALLLVSGLNNAYAQNWDRLSANEQTVLRPLRSTWEELPTEQRQQWLNKAPELQRMSQSQLKTSQERMAEWGSLSNKQRTNVEKKLSNNSFNNADSRAKNWNSFTNQK